MGRETINKEDQKVRGGVGGGVRIQCVCVCGVCVREGCVWGGRMKTKPREEEEEGGKKKRFLSCCLSLYCSTEHPVI